MLLEQQKIFMERISFFRTKKHTEKDIYCCNNFTCDLTFHAGLDKHGLSAKAIEIL